MESTGGLPARFRWKHWLALVAFAALCFAAAAFGAVLTTGAVRTWYAEVQKPAWSPPDRVFGPVWTALYLMMACAAWLVWLKAGLSGGRVPLTLFLVQLVLNAAWSPVFFGLRSFGGAFALIVVLWLAIVATVVAFARVSRPAAWLLVPYLAWVSFAACLNYSIWRLNA